MYYCTCRTLKLPFHKYLRVYVLHILTLNENSFCKLLFEHRMNLSFKIKILI